MRPNGIGEGRREWDRPSQGQSGYECLNGVFCTKPAIWTGTWSASSARVRHVGIGGPKRCSDAISPFHLVPKRFSMIVLP